MSLLCTQDRKEGDRMPEANDDWKLLVGRIIELRQNGRHIRTAEVEDATVDSSVMWLRFDGNHGRQLITHSDGYEIHVIE